ncbi:MAG: class I tRNA ligase family protein, partial [Clostridia bacterium]
MKNFVKERPKFPERAVITAGMPYGNKQLHFGHVGGMFVHADTFARFMRDRIGKENVIFVSGTDCYGSPALEGYRKIVEDGFAGTIEDYVGENHIHQKETLKKYEIEPNLFTASGVGESVEMHKLVSNELFQKLYENGTLVKDSTPQFFDTKFGVFLNGRQVVGKCPFEGCASDKAYADECALGHQYTPSELIEPKSTLSGETPELREVTNWYFSLDNYLDTMTEICADLKRNSNTRKFILKAIEEFLKQPVIYVQKSQVEDISALTSKMPVDELIDEEKKPSYTLVFKSLKDRDKARGVLQAENIRFKQ